MLLGGLWHGADWTFVFWGILNGLALCIDKIAFKQDKKGFPGAFSTLGTFLFITFTWIFFRAESFTTAWIFIKGICTFQDGIRQPFSWSFLAIIILGISTIVAGIYAKKNQTEIRGYYPILDLNSVMGLTIFFVEIGLILGLAFTGENPFVYFQF